MTAPLCDFTSSLTCPTCGYRAKSRPTFRVCRPPPVQRWRPFLLGNFVERWLTRLGVTKERVERWTRTAGKPGGCGCASRQLWLNEWGIVVQRWFRDAAAKYRQFVLP